MRCGQLPPAPARRSSLTDIAYESFEPQIPLAGFTFAVGVSLRRYTRNDAVFIGRTLSSGPARCPALSPATRRLPAQARNGGDAMLPPIWQELSVARLKGDSRSCCAAACAAASTTPPQGHRVVHSSAPRLPRTDTGRCRRPASDATPLISTMAPTLVSRPSAGVSG